MSLPIDPSYPRNGAVAPNAVSSFLGAGEYRYAPRRPFPQYIAIGGIPGSGKSTLAAGLAGLGYRVVSTGTIAREADAGSVAAGSLACEDKFRKLFGLTFEVGPALIFDGIPRHRAQLSYLPSATLVLGLTCRIDIARARLLGRARSDDDSATIERRLKEQACLLEVDVRDGWFYRDLGWGRVINTSLRTPEEVLGRTMAFLRGHKSEIF